MSNYRRAYVAGGSYFFTLVTWRRQRVFGDQFAIESLRSAMRKVRRNRPSDVEGIVVLPDHLHCILQLPEGDPDFSGRWREIKKACSRRIAPASDHRRERRVWQRRFWEHAIRDDDDWRRRMLVVTELWKGVAVSIQKLGVHHGKAGMEPKLAGSVGTVGICFVYFCTCRMADRCDYRENG